jgi:hypothetical protein
MTKKPLACQACRRLTGKRGTIECRNCGRMTCKHYTASVTDQDGQRYDPLRDPRPAKLLGTCTPCRLNRA